MMALKRRSDLHLARKLWHVGGVGIMALIYTYAPYEVAMAILAGTWLAFVPVDIFRHFSPTLNRLALKTFGLIMRDHEEKKLAGTTYLLTGAAIVGLAFPREVVQPTLLFLAFADPFASLIGIKYGTIKIFGHKSLQGFLAAFFICFVLSFSYLGNHGLLANHQFTASLLAGLVGALAELIPIGNLDDNLTLPVLSAVGLCGIYILFGHPITLGVMF